MTWRRLYLYYLTADWLACVVAWLIFFIYRKQVEFPYLTIGEALHDNRLIIGLCVIPISWICLFSFLGHYADLRDKTRITWIVETFLAAFIGGIILLFSVLTDDTSLSYISYVRSFSVLFILHTALLVIMRLMILGIWMRRIRSGALPFKALAIKGSMNGDIPGPLPAGVKCTSSLVLKELSDVIWDNVEVKFDDVLIHLKNPGNVIAVLNGLGSVSDLLKIRVSEQTYASLNNTLLVQPLPGEAWITLRGTSWPPFSRHIKRLMDIAVSIISFGILSPIIVWCAFRVRKSSPGPVIYRQERVGRRGVSFTMYKFRSMYDRAEDKGPALSSDEDERCTPWGSFMRKWRLDEIPQFYNVIKGDMSIVGPRPERPFYVDQIRRQVPNYNKILSVRPGITSWGQIKYGYASSVEEMLQRLRYDLLYIDNLSLLLDIRILYHTLLVLGRGMGK